MNKLQHSLNRLGITRGDIFLAASLLLFSAALGIIIAFTRPEPEEPQPDTKEPLSEPGPEISEDASDGSDLLPEFDIMALLEEQLESYSEMGLEERMEEIDVVTMEISFEELAAFIKDKRKKRGA